MAKIAVELEDALRRRAISGEPGSATARVLAAGEGWSVSDVICTSGPEDRKFEEAHAGFSIAIVAAGTFQYRSSSHKELLAPGSFLLGNHDQAFECGHDHGAGDRCIAFKYAPELFETLVPARSRFSAVRLPPLRASAPLVARACAAVAGATDVSWEELAIEVASQTIELLDDVDPTRDAAPLNAIARVTDAIRTIERNPDADLSLQLLASDARLSPFHFLRTFAQIAGMTPHQFAVRLRLREAALRLALDDALVIDIALDCGFGDLSNFNRSFRTEFGVAPRAYRKGMRGGAAASAR